MPIGIDAPRAEPVPMSPNGGAHVPQPYSHPGSYELVGYSFERLGCTATLRSPPPSVRTNPLRWSCASTADMIRFLTASLRTSFISVHE